MEDLLQICDHGWVQNVQDVFGQEYARSECQLQVVEPVKEDDFMMELLDATVFVGSYADRSEDLQERRVFDQDLNDGLIKIYKAEDPYLYRSIPMNVVLQLHIKTSCTLDILHSDGSSLHGSLAKQSPEPDHSHEYHKLDFIGNCGFANNGAKGMLRMRDKLMRLNNIFVDGRQISR